MQNQKSEILMNEWIQTAHLMFYKIYVTLQICIKEVLWFISIFLEKQFFFLPHIT